MDDHIITKLIDLNRTFYQTFAEEFSSTRQRLQPGVIRVLDLVSTLDSILELGCGNGELAKALIARGHQGIYTGIDSNQSLLEIARDQSSPAVDFLERDLSDPNWDQNLPKNAFNFVFAFAVLHHLPGQALREQILSKTRDLLEEDGNFIHSEWQFLNSTRLKERIQPWEAVGMQSNQVDPGDYLLDWRHGGVGLRYVHLFSQAELETLATQAGFKISKTFSSDGEGGNLGLYQIWKRV